MKLEQLDKLSAEVSSIQVFDMVEMQIKFLLQDVIRRCREMLIHIEPESVRR